MRLGDAADLGTGPRALVGQTEMSFEGVRRAEVSFRDKEARVVYDPGLVAVEEMIAAVNAAARL